MNVNVYGPYRVTKAFAPLIVETEGRITTIGSISGILSSARLASNSMSKHAIEAYTDHKDPAEVTDAVYDAIFSENPKRRYLVVPDEKEADWTMRQIMREAAQLNYDQPFSYYREALIQLLHEVTAEVAAARNPLQRNSVNQEEASE